MVNGVLRSNIVDVTTGIATHRVVIPAGTYNIRVRDVNAILDKRSQNGIHQIRGLEIG